MFPPPTGRRLPVGALLLALACLAPVRAAAQPEPHGRGPTPEWAVRGERIPADVQRQELKALQRDLLWLGARHRMAEARERAAAERAARRGRSRPGTHIRPAGETEPAPPPDPGARTALPSLLEDALAIPTNVQVNNTVGDTANAGQAEESIGALGSHVLVAWNDGQGYRRPTTDTQAAAWSVNGGAIWTEIALPKPAAWPSWRWYSDPIVTVDEKTGRFYYCAMAAADGTHNGIGVCYGHFTGSTFAWDGVSVVRSVLNTSGLLDKPWCVADSVTGNVYVSYTNFLSSSSNRIEIQRSTDGAVTWGGAFQVSPASEDGTVQGSRPAVGPDGTVYLAWTTIGPFYSDYLRLRVSSPGGTSWSTVVTVDSVYAQYGTGAPGYNREKGITFPSIAVDRTNGTWSGRLYVTWNETWNIMSTTFGINDGQAEVEPNNAASTATLFTPGQTLRGQLSSTSPMDYDWWKFSLAAGQSIVVWVDSLSANMTYVCRLQAPAPDSSQRLCYGGDLSNPSRTVPLKAFYMFTAPATGTYFLRVFPYSTGSTLGRYRIQTALGAGPGGYRARDQRDVFVRSSDDQGNTWSATKRVNDSGIGFDDFLPEIAVGPDGMPYVEWLDFRNDAYGSRAHQYLSRSPNGSAWAASQRLTSAQGNFTTCLSNLMPNEGDYSHLAADTRYVRPVWADARGANVDVWSTSFDTWFTLTGCAASRNVDAGATTSLSWTVNNLNPLFSNAYPWTLTNDWGWPVTASGMANVTAGGTGTITVTVSVPDTTHLGSNGFHLAVRNFAGTRVQTCDATLTVTGPLDVAGRTPVLELSPARPTPARGAVSVRWTLPQAARATLRVYGLQGDLVRTLEDGPCAAGEHERSWDGLDQRGRPVGSGAYFVRLEVPGRALTRRIVWMR